MLGSVPMRRAGALEVSDEQLRSALADAFGSLVIEGDTVEAVFVFALCCQTLSDRSQRPSATGSGVVGSRG
jgi:hypothetical protein